MKIKDYLEEEIYLDSDGDETLVEESHLFNIENYKKHPSLIFKNYHYKWHRKNLLINLFFNKLFSYFNR